MGVTARSRTGVKPRADVRKLHDDKKDKVQKKPRSPRKRDASRRAQSRQHDDDASDETDDESVSGEVDRTDEARIIVKSLYKSDLGESAFFGSVSSERDYFSPVPAEVAYQIFDYCVLDHHPERARMEHSSDHDFQANPHVFASLAAMSRHFRRLIEDFSRRFLIKHRAFYTSAASIDAVRQGQRRSQRIAAVGAPSYQVHRMTLVKALRERCIQCGRTSDHYAIMYNGVACHPECELQAFPGRVMVSSSNIVCLHY
nr:hypothetical protein CFP56_76752 [Quercus suber]